MFAAKPDKLDSQGNEVSWAHSECAKIQDGELYASTGELLTTGYDEFGYNYQAHIFNGKYCDYERVIGGDYCDVELIMKWNDAWLSNVDCNNDSLLDRYYGFDSYIGSGAWLTNHQSGEYTDWNVLGDWVFEFDYNSRKHPHDVHIETFEDGVFTAKGIHQIYFQTWTATGTVSEDDFTMRIMYDGSSYTVDVVGTISEDGTISGDWNSSPWNYFVKIVAVPTDAYVDEGIWYTADGIEIGEVIWGAFAIIQQVENDACTGLHGQQYLSPTRAGLGNW